MFVCPKSENPNISQTDAVKRICKLTKIPYSTIYFVIKRGVIEHSQKRKRVVSRRIDDASKDMIRRTVLDIKS